MSLREFVAFSILLCAGSMWLGAASYAFYNFGVVMCPPPPEVEIEVCRLPLPDIKSC